MQAHCKHAFAAIEEAVFTVDPPRGYITKDFTQIELELGRVFWRWQPKVIEKKWQEMNKTVPRRLHVWSEVTVRQL
jgi:hypothetical protein